jgi:hypothetical protein
VNRFSIGVGTASLALLATACSSAPPAAATTAAAPATSVSAYASAGAVVGTAARTPTAAASATSSAPTASPAATSTAPTARTATSVRAGRYAVGDSVMLGARSALRSRGFAVNATESRQFSAAVSILRSRKAAGTLPRNVIVHLGTNGYISLADCKAVINVAGSARRVFLVNNRVPRVWQAANNRTLRTCDASFAAGRALVVDWYRHSQGRGGWLYSDGFHLTPTGRTAYASFVDAAVDRNRL